MRAEIIGVGTELLLGQIANTNAQEISQALASAGIDVNHHVVVGDNPERIVDTFRSALGRADAVIVTGGLGPTPDDITREAVAEVLGAPLQRDEALVEQIGAIFQRLGREMPEDNLRQADVPTGATTIPPEGTAPGFMIESDSSVLFALPGVPWEMRAMLGKVVIPELRRRAGDAAIASREVLVMGLGESHTHQLIADIVAAQTNPTIAFLAGAGRVRVRLTAKAQTEAAAIALIRPVEEQIRQRLGDSAVEGEGGDLAVIVGELLRERGMSVAVCESLTGGGLAAQVSAAGGSSDFFVGGLVTYATESKASVAEVPASILQGPGAVSEEAAAAMAEAARKKFDADIGLATTGVAGPSEQEGKPVGTIFVAASLAGRTEVRKVQGYGDRSNIRATAANAALDLGRRLLLSEEG